MLFIIQPPTTPPPKFKSYLWYPDIYVWVSRVGWWGWWLFLIQPPTTPPLKFKSYLWYPDIYVWVSGVGWWGVYKNGKKFYRFKNECWAQDVSCADIKIDFGYISQRFRERIWSGSFVGPSSILWSHWLPLFWTSCDPPLPHRFQSQGSFLICTLSCLLTVNLTVMSPIGVYTACVRWTHLLDIPHSSSGG